MARQGLVLEGAAVEGGQGLALEDAADRGRDIELFDARLCQSKLMGRTWHIRGTAQAEV